MSTQNPLRNRLRGSRTSESDVFDVKTAREVNAPGRYTLYRPGAVLRQRVNLITAAVLQS